MYCKYRVIVNILYQENKCKEFYELGSMRVGAAWTCGAAFPRQGAACAPLTAVVPRAEAPLPARHSRPAASRPAGDRGALLPGLLPGSSSHLPPCCPHSLSLTLLFIHPGVVHRQDPARKQNLKNKPFFSFQNVYVFPLGESVI